MISPFRISFRSKRLLVNLALLSEYYYRLKSFRSIPRHTTRKTFSVLLFAWLFFLRGLILSFVLRDSITVDNSPILLSPFARSLKSSLYSLSTLRRYFSKSNIACNDIFIYSNAFSSSIYSPSGAILHCNITLYQLLIFTCFSISKLLSSYFRFRTPLLKDKRIFDFSSIRNLALSNSFAALFRQNIYFFHTFEGHGWERAVSLALSNKQKILIAYQQAPLSYQHAEHLSCPAPLYRPKRLLLSGQAIHDLIRTHYSLLHCSLVKSTYSFIPYSKPKDISLQKTLLILPESLPSIESQFLKIIPSLLEAFSDFDVIVRPHPNSSFHWSFNSDRVTISSYKRIEDDIKRSSIVVGSGSKSVLQAIQHGCVPLIYLDDLYNNIMWPIDPDFYAFFDSNTPPHLISLRVYNSLRHYSQISVFASQYFQDFVSIGFDLS